MPSNNSKSTKKSGRSGKEKVYHHDNESNFVSDDLLDGDSRVYNDMYNNGIDPPRGFYGPPQYSTGTSYHPSGMFPDLDSQLSDPAQYGVQPAGPSLLGGYRPQISGYQGQFNPQGPPPRRPDTHASPNLFEHGPIQPNHGLYIASSARGTGGSNPYGSRSSASYTTRSARDNSSISGSYDPYGPRSMRDDSDSSDMEEEYNDRSVNSSAGHSGASRGKKKHRRR